MISSLSDRITLAGGVTMPVLGAGAFKLEDEGAAAIVRAYLETGYRLIDTAVMYGNEAGVGRGIRESGLPREDVFVTTKLWTHDPDPAMVETAFTESLARLQMDYVDLYLIHWPKPALDRYVGIWKAFERIWRSGRARAIGVSNFQPAHLDRLARECEVVPMVNQIEVHPYLSQKALCADLKSRGIAIQAWAPLARGRAAEDPVLQAIARKHGCTVAQVILRWHLQNGLAPIPKSADRGRMVENTQVFGFALDSGDLAQIDALDRGMRTGSDPDNMNSN